MFDFSWVPLYNIGRPSWLSACLLIFQMADGSTYSRRDLGSAELDDSVPRYLEFCRDVVMTAQPVDKRTARPRPYWRIDGDRWNSIASMAATGYGDAPLLAMGIINSMFRGYKPRKTAKNHDLFAGGIPLADRLRVAWTRSNEARWWEDRFSQVEQGGSASLGALYACTIMGPESVEATVAEVGEVVAELDDDTYSGLLNAVHGLHSWVSRRSFASVTDRAIRSMTPRHALLLHGMGRTRFAERVWKLKLSKYRGPDAVAARLCAQHAAGYNVPWEEMVRRSRRVYRMDGRPQYTYRQGSIPAEAAAQIVSRANEYPLEWVLGAERTGRSEVGRGRPRMSAVAHRERWFARR
jgi:hypothetical protein